MKDLTHIHSSSSSSQPSGGLKQPLVLNPPANGPAIPWRRANVRHTSNELYVDIIETLAVTLAPSGRPLAAFVHGSIAFMSKISGVPDLLLTLSVGGGKQAIDKIIELPVFHPCVRLARWKERPGELSFVPPDGKFTLAGYEVNLLPSLDITSLTTKNLNLPANLEVLTSLGPSGSDFEVRILLSSTFAGVSTQNAAHSSAGSRGSGRSTPFFGSGGSSATPLLQDVVVSIPIPHLVRNITEIRPSRGEAHFASAENMVEWRIPTKDAISSRNATATLRCTLVGPMNDDDINNDAASKFRFDAADAEYDENDDTYQSLDPSTAKPSSAKEQPEQREIRKVEQSAPLMPSSASLSFSIKGWLASGIKVESLNVDVRKSRGLSDGVKPVKGVKYHTVSKKGIETRC